MNGYIVSWHFPFLTCTYGILNVLSVVHVIISNFFPFFGSFTLSCPSIFYPLKAILTSAFVLFSKKRGLDDKDLLSYFPYRDDGEKLLNVIESMVEEYVDL